MSDPDMYYNYTPTFAAAESGKQQLGAVSRAAFPQTVHVPEGKHTSNNFCSLQSSYVHFLRNSQCVIQVAGLFQLQITLNQIVIA